MQPKSSMGRKSERMHWLCYHLCFPSSLQSSPPASLFFWPVLIPTFMLVLFSPSDLGFWILDLTFSSVGGNTHIHTHTCLLICEFAFGSNPTPDVPGRNYFLVHTPVININPCCFRIICVVACSNRVHLEKLTLSRACDNNNAAAGTTSQPAVL